jgi:hypothetical protein
MGSRRVLIKARRWRQQRRQWSLKVWSGSSQRTASGGHAVGLLVTLQPVWHNTQASSHEAHVLV